MNRMKKKIVLQFIQAKGFLSSNFIYIKSHCNGYSSIINDMTVMKTSCLSYDRPELLFPIIMYYHEQ